SQTPVVNALFAQHPSALIIAPTDSTGMKAPIQQFTKANIPVVSVDTTLKDTSILDARITSDNTQGGKAAADTLAKLAHGKGSVAIINVNPGVSTTDARQAGFIKEMQTKYPNMKIVAKEYDQDSATKAATEASSIMLANPNLVGIFGTNVFSAEGAGKAVQSAHKGGKVFVAGYDAEPAEVKLLKSGVINALVMQQPAKEGSLAVQDAYDILTGKKSQVTKSVTLPNVVATTKTASNPDVSKYFYASSFNG
ncbi:MAG: ABC transporter substrate-binding protein, partial [Acidimicrobiales bacterium]